MDTSRSETLLCEGEALTESGFAPDEMVERNPDIAIQDLGMTSGFTRAMVGFSHRGHIAQDLHTGCRGRHDDHRVRRVGARIGVTGSTHHDQEIADRSIRREPFVTVDHPLVAVAHRSGRQQRRIGTGAGFGHRETAAQPALEQRLHPPLLLILGAADRDQFRVPTIGGVVAENRRGVGTTAEDLMHETQLDLAESETTEIRGKMGGPQALPLDLFFERGGDLEEGAAAFGAAPTIRQALERQDLVVDETTHPDQFLLELGFGREIPGHVLIPSPTPPPQ